MPRLLVRQWLRVVEPENNPRSIIMYYYDDKSVLYRPMATTNPELEPLPNWAIEGMCLTFTDKEFKTIERRCAVYPAYKHWDGAWREAYE